MLTVEPHRYEPLGFLDIFLPNGRCRRCLFPRQAHVSLHRDSEYGVNKTWVMARGIGDTRRFTFWQAHKIQQARSTQISRARDDRRNT
jgi:hypothetical protein